MSLVPWTQRLPQLASGCPYGHRPLTGNRTVCMPSPSLGCPLSPVPSSATQAATAALAFFRPSPRPRERGNSPVNATAPRTLAKACFLSALVPKTHCSQIDRIVPYSAPKRRSALPALVYPTLLRAVCRSFASLLPRNHEYRQSWRGNNRPHDQPHHEGAYHPADLAKLVGLSLLNFKEHQSPKREPASTQHP